MDDRGVADDEEGKRIDWLTAPRALAHNTNRNDFPIGLNRNLTYLYIYIYTHVHIYIHICRERSRERGI